jgi:hypothetical protein
MAYGIELLSGDRVIADVFSGEWGCPQETDFFVR